MTFFYPDISAFEAGIPLAGAGAVCIKVTEGTGWLSPDWLPALSRAKAAGAWPFAYHFLHQGNATAQAAWCHAHAGSYPLMLDWEPTGSSNPGVADAEAFIDAYRADGGTCDLAYFPHWYWGQLGSPSLAGIAGRKCALVSSDYTAYSDTGPGWAGYGGMVPEIWQYTDAGLLAGQRVDFNAYRGTLDQLKALAAGVSPPPPGDPEIRLGSTGPAVTKAQTRLNVWGASPPLAEDGQFGPKTDAATRKFQARWGMTVDGIIGPVTWAKLNAVPVSPAPTPVPPAPPHHGQYATDGTKSLAALASLLGYPPGQLLSMTAAHYGSLETGTGADLGRYADEVFKGSMQAAAPVPPGAIIWCD